LRQLLASVLALAVLAGVSILGSAARAGGSSVRTQQRLAPEVPSAADARRLAAAAAFSDPSGTLSLVNVPPPPPTPAALGAKAVAQSRGSHSRGGNPALARLHATASAAVAARQQHANGTLGSPARFGVSNRSDPSAVEVRQLRRKYHGRKFLLPLLDQGPNNQFLQFRIAMSKARQLNRTLVLPVWLPHNPKFQHLHPGAPATPSRDKRLDQVWYPFESAFDADAVGRYVRTISLAHFRALLPPDGRLEHVLCGSNPRLLLLLPRGRCLLLLLLLLLLLSRGRCDGGRCDGSCLF
jgi:hypothetical protein